MSEQLMRFAVSRVRRPVALATSLFVAATLVATGWTAQQSAQASPQERGGFAVKVLSSRADLISGGDALVEVALPRGLNPAKVKVTVAGRDVTRSFAVRRDGRFLGLVKNLAPGASLLRAKGGGFSDKVTVTNHRNGGPVFSGPQLMPWKCQPTAVDKQCNQPATYEYFYKSAVPVASAGFKPYDPANPPADVATTTTDQGVTVPFIIRVETGYQDRDQYKIATLYRPGQKWKPWAPQKQWNHKVLMTHGGGCGISYGAGGAPSVHEGIQLPLVGDVLPIDLPVTDEAPAMLARGFAVVSTALNNNGHNCNISVQAESMMMVKEHLVETYGEIRYTIGSGCSGGSITQQAVANAYPGIYQGLVVSCSYPDTASPGAQFFDYHLLRKYFERFEPLAKGWTPLQWAAVEGHLLPLNAIVADEGLFKGAFQPTTACPGISDQQRYHPDTNPGGVRCNIFEGQVNQFGRRKPAVWSANERKLGKGFVGVPVDNVGVQYGLEALESGVITPEQFVDLNATIGGLDIDARPQAKRTVADRPALENSYRDGWHNSANNLENVAIIDHGGPDPGLAHDARWAWSMRERLDRTQGHHDNHVVWFGQFPIIGDPSYFTEGLLAMDRWLAAVEADKRDVPVADKIVQDRPGDLRDRCSQVQALTSPDGLNIPLLSPLIRQLLGPALNPILDAVNKGLNPVLDPALRLIVDPVLEVVCGAGVVGKVVRTDFDTPRGVAGQNTTSDDHKCQLKPLNRNADYGVLGLSDAQWNRLKAAFPSGVCDFSKPGVGKGGTVPWLTYQDCHGKVLTGGQPLGTAPADSAGGWNSPAFDGWQRTGKRGDLGSCPTRTSSTSGSSVQPEQPGSPGQQSGPPEQPGPGVVQAGNASQQGQPVVGAAAGSAEAGADASANGVLPAAGAPRIATIVGLALAMLVVGAMTVRRGRRALQ
ncbi:DUF6351 family protein [Nocardioides speluncae]|uniref:DUF6351 family protein n=1 Tax=Nocardioides speluncae TaxID=2670337 RepID=UPI0012B16E10|nr:DUF6351 family protein [Nocardioides speluncae]